MRVAVLYAVQPCHLLSHVTGYGAGNMHPKNTQMGLVLGSRSPRRSGHESRRSV